MSRLYSILIIEKYIYIFLNTSLYISILIGEGVGGGGLRQCALPALSNYHYYTAHATAADPPFKVSCNFSDEIFEI